MSGYLLEPTANQALDEIYAYTLETWGDAQAERYLTGLFTRFGDIVARRTPWRSVPPEFEVEAWFCRYEHHVIYWKERADGRVGIMAILHERMHQAAQLRIIDGED